MALKLVRTKTRHPAAGMTPAQRRDFERIAINQRPLGGVSVIKALEARGLIVEGPPKVLGCDQLGEIKVREWYVPTPIHAQWCQWASEHLSTEIDSELAETLATSEASPEEKRIGDALRARATLTPGE